MDSGKTQCKQIGFGIGFGFVFLGLTGFAGFSLKDIENLANSVE
jgi:hypothetical protein